MFFAIHFNMPFEVPDKDFEAARQFAIKITHKAAKHFRDQVLAAKGKGSGDNMQLTLIAYSIVARGITAYSVMNQGKRAFNESLCLFGCSRLRQSVFCIRACMQGMENMLHCLRTRSAGAHGLQIKLKVAQGATFVHITFFTENDLVDEPARFRVFRGKPWKIDACEPTLQGFQQRHKIPDSEYVRFHEKVERLECLDGGIEGMFRQPRAERRDPVL